MADIHPLTRAAVEATVKAVIDRLHRLALDPDIQRMTSQQALTAVAEALSKNICPLPGELNS